MKPNAAACLADQPGDRQTSPSPRAVFELRCWARAHLFAAGELELAEAVDGLQAAAERDGLVDEIGQDAVQAILAAAFAAVRAELERVPDALPDDDASGRRVAKSTLAAAEYLVSTNNPDNLRAWLARQTAQERAAIRKHLEAVRCRSRSSK